MADDNRPAADNGIIAYLKKRSVKNKFRVYLNVPAETGA